MTDYGDLLLDAVRCAHEAGNIHLSYFRKVGLSIQAKRNNESDIVTAADKAAEAAILNFIHNRYPTHSILSEESGEEVREAEYEWVIDPLDGTTNFSSGLPEFSVSIGIRHCGVTVVGVVYAPYLNELFHAVRGEGHFLTGKGLRVETRRRSTVAWWPQGFPSTRTATPTTISTMCRACCRLCEVSGG